MDGVVIAFEAGVSGVGAGASGGGGGGGCCAEAMVASVKVAAAARSAEPRGAMTLNFFCIAFLPRQNRGSQESRRSHATCEPHQCCCHFAAIELKIETFSCCSIFKQVSLSKAADKIGVDCFGNHSCYWITSPWIARS